MHLWFVCLSVSAASCASISMQKQGLNVSINLPFSHAFCSFILPFHYLLCLLLLHAVSFTQAHTTVRPAVFMRQKVKEWFSVTARHGADRLFYECRITSHCVAHVSSICHRTAVTGWSVKRRSTFKCDTAFTYLGITITSTLSCSHPQTQKWFVSMATLTTPKELQST